MTLPAPLDYAELRRVADYRARLATLAKSIGNPWFSDIPVISRKHEQEFKADLLALLAEREALVEALRETRRLVAKASESGFTDEEAVRALFVNNGAITKLVPIVQINPKPAGGE